MGQKNVQIKFWSNDSPECRAIAAELTRLEFDFVEIPSAGKEDEVPRIETPYLTIRGYHYIMVYILPELPPRHELLAAS